MKLFSTELTSLPDSLWAPVWFNAWENNRVEQPWWLLYRRLFQAVLRRAQQSTKPAKGSSMRVREALWRLTVGNRENIALISVGLFVLCATWVVWHPISQNLDTTGKTVATLVGLVTTAGGVLRTIANGLLGGGSKAAQGFVEAAQDPMSLLRRHYKRFLDSSDVKLIVFIDDLDRCSPAYVVRVLEGIQTLFGHPQVCWMIAADRRWLAHSFEAAFPGLTPEFKDLAEPGNRFGYLFVEKAFQLFMTLPELRGPAKEEYWNRIVRGPLEVAPNVTPSAIFTPDMNEVEILTALADRSEADPAGANAYRQEAVRRLVSRGAEESVRHFLTPFSGLIRSNPRAMKRLANSYTIFRDVAILSGISIKPGEGRRHELARWTILAMDAPSLLDALEQNPALLTNAKPGELPNDLPKELESLWLKARIQTLLFGQPTHRGLELSVLTSDRVLEFAALRGERL